MFYKTPVVLLAGYSSININIYISVPVITVTITPGDDNNVYVLEEEIWTVTCAADSSRPAAWI
jgi:hypothetical protein